MISPFKDIWERDKTKKKDKALKDFKYIEFMTSALPSNPFRLYSKSIRHKMILERVLNDDKYQPDDLVMKAMMELEEYQNNSSPVYSLWKAAVYGAKQLEKMLYNINPMERTKQGALVYSPKLVQQTIETLGGTFSKLKEYEKNLYDDLKEGFKIYGDREIGYFNDPENLKDVFDEQV